MTGRQAAENRSPMTRRLESSSGHGITAVIPTYGREEVLLGSIGALLQLVDRPDEIVVVDQTAEHDEATHRRLSRWHEEGLIRWVRLPVPSIPKAMNQGLLLSTQPVVLFIDDDVVPGDGLVGAHRRAHADESVFAVTGQVLQPGQTAEMAPASSSFRAGGLRRDLDFPFNSTARCVISNAMAGNLSVKTERAIAAGGFDENFVGASYRFETEFCRRLERMGGLVVFEPSAVIHHLRAPSGGTRTNGSHLTSAGPAPSVGDYYFAMVEASGRERWAYILKRVVREVRTRFHLRRPWWIPVKLLGEVRGFLWAVRLARRGPHYIASDGSARETV
jgi:GT2 family glycosyltransferase